MAGMVPTRKSYVSLSHTIPTYNSDKYDTKFGARALAQEELTKRSARHTCVGGHCRDNKQESHSLSV
jgi:hypothetical protein